MGEPDRTGRFEVADRIFSDAINLPEAQRTAFVREKSGSDSGLCDSVLRLLANFERLGSFLESPAVSVPAESVPEFRTGEVLCNRFKIAERIGCGGMGEVFRAEDLALGDMVALKTIRPGWRGDPGMLSRFREEIRLARRISHPNVCKIFDLFTHDSAERSQPFFTMEYLNGDTLSDRLRSGPLLQGEALALAEQIALGLDAAHAAGVVHRDLKPANILLVHGTQGVRAVITDFGLARTFAAEEGHGGLTHAGQILGSPDYMAPEQFEGREITSAADIFAFGLIVFEMLCGRRPYPSDSLFQAAVRRLTENPAPIRQFAPEIPASRERAISKCLARNPAERYPSAGAFIKDLSPDGAMWRLADSAPSRRSILLAGSVAAPVAAIFGFYRYLKWKPGMPDVPLVMLNSLTHASGDSVEADAVELILKKDLAQSAHIRVLTMEEVSATWRRISNVPAVSQPPAAFDPRLAREIALRKGAQIAVFGNLGRVAERRVLLLQIELLGGTPEEARKTWTNQFAAARPSDLASVGRDAGGWIRRTIGESAGDIETRNRLPEDLTTPYWAALEEFVRAN